MTQTTLTRTPDSLDTDTNLYRILALVSFVNLSALERQELEDLIHSLNDHQSIELAQLIADNAITVKAIQLLDQWGLLPLVANKAPYIWQSLGEQAHNIRIRGEKRTKHLLRFLSAAEQRGIQIILLKGSMLGPAVYNDLVYKKMNDIDIMVRPEGVERIKVLAHDLGFEVLGELFDDRENDLKKNHHLTPLVSSDLSFILGVHWGLSSPYAKWKPDLESVWREAKPLPVATADAYRMSWEHCLAHLCMHLPFYKIGTRELSDIYNLLRVHAIDWDVFVATARSWKIQNPAYRVLSLCNAITSVVPNWVLEQMKLDAEGLHLTDTNLRIQDPYRLFRSRSVQVGRIEKAFGLFRIAPGLIDRSRAIFYMWKQTLFPPVKEAVVLLAYSRQRTERTRRSYLRSFVARTAAGKRIWLAMAVDYGQIALVYMTASNVVTWIKTCLSYLIKPVILKTDSRVLRLQELLE